MAILPPVRRFILDDYQGISTIPSFCTKFFYPLNLFLSSTYSALNNGLTLQSNTVGLVANINPVTSSSTGTATTTVNWTYPQTPPQGVVVMNCTLNGTGVTAPLISWSYSSGVITISMQFVKVSSGAIVQAQAATYAVTFWVSGG
jgi:negative regulator of sigma E activity